MRQLRIAAEQSAIDRTLIEQQAVADLRPIDPEAVQREIGRFCGTWGGIYDQSGMAGMVERRIRVERANRELLESAEPVSPEEVRAFFDAHHKEFPKPEMFRASHIVKYINRMNSAERAKAGITEALDALNAGEPFADVADRLSDCSDKGGNLDQFPVGHMVAEFEEVLRTLEPGERSGVIATDFGLHIALLHEKLPAGLAEFADVRVEIERVLTFAKRHETYAKAVAKLRETAEIRFVPPVQRSPQNAPPDLPQDHA